MRISAQDLTTTRDCQAAGCTQDANSSGYCDEHQAYLRGASQPGRPSEATWTKAQVVDALKRWARQRGRFPGAATWQRREDGYPSYTDVRKHFDSWRDALAAAGCPTDVPTSLVRVEANGAITIVQDPAVTRAPARPTAPDPPPPEPQPEPEPTPEPEAEPEAEPDFTAVAIELQAAHDEYDAARTRLWAALADFAKHPFIQLMDEEFDLFDDLRREGAAAA